jgi:hypothetical protein
VVKEAEWVLAFGPKGIFETMILAEFSNFRRRKFPFPRLRKVAAVGGQILQ